MSRHDELAELLSLPAQQESSGTLFETIAAIRALEDGPVPAASPALQMFLDERSAAAPLTDKGDLTATSASNVHGPAIPQVAELPKRRRNVIIELLTGAASKVAGLGLMAQVGLGTAVAAASVTGAGVAGVLPGPVQDTVASVVETVTPFDLPDSSEEQVDPADLPTDLLETPDAPDSEPSDLPTPTIEESDAPDSEPSDLPTPDGYETPDAPDDYETPDAPDDYETPDAPDDYDTPDAPDDYDTPDSDDTPDGPTGGSAPTSTSGYDAPDAPDSDAPDSDAPDGAEDSDW